jgi:hypothetical protein
MYDKKLVRSELQELGDELRAKFAATKAQVGRCDRHKLAGGHDNVLTCHWQDWLKLTSTVVTR